MAARELKAIFFPFCYHNWKLFLPYPVKCEFTHHFKQFYFHLSWELRFSNFKVKLLSVIGKLFSKIKQSSAIVSFRNFIIWSCKTYCWDTLCLLIIGFSFLKKVALLKKEKVTFDSDRPFLCLSWCSTDWRQCRNSDNIHVEGEGVGEHKV